MEQKNSGGNDDDVGAVARNAVLFLTVEGVAVVVVVLILLNVDNAVLLLLKHEEVEMTKNLQQRSKRNGTGNQREKTCR